MGAREDRRRTGGRRAIVLKGIAADGGLGFGLDLVFVVGVALPRHLPSRPSIQSQPRAYYYKLYHYMITAKYLLLRNPTTSVLRHFNSSTALPQRSASKFAAVCARVGYATKRASGAQGGTRGHRGPQEGTSGLWPWQFLSLLRRQKEGAENSQKHNVLLMCC